MTRRPAKSDRTPPPAGPYSPSVRIGALVAGSGQVGTDTDGRLQDGVGAQTRQALTNLVDNMAAGGASADDVISVRVFLTDPSQFAAMNEAYAAVFTEPYPARTTVFVRLPEGMLVEIDALAVIGP